MIPDSFKQELLHRVDIVDVIERYVPLKKGGANYSACCPFHTEKTPSFTVSPTKQFYHCFGCGVHGNAISFLIEYQGLGYVEAVKDLAESVGMKMPEFEARTKKPEDGPDLYEIMKRACDYYRDQLKATPRAIEYLKGRGLTGKIAASFGIGYAPDGWQNLESVFPSYADKALKDAGLVIDIVVEGYMDVVALAQHGIEYAVATLGTATSATHIQKLLRQTDEVVFCFDGDAAGRKAAWHALEVSLPYLADNKAVRFLFLPPEHDPDSFVREEGKEAFEKRLGDSRPLSEFLLEELKSRTDLGTAEGRSRLAHEAKPLLQKVSAPALRLQLLKALAEAAGMAYEEAAQLTGIRIPSGYGSKPAPLRGAERGAQLAERKPERTLLQCLLSKPGYAKELPAELLDHDSFEGSAILMVAEFCRENPNADGNLVVEHFRETELKVLLESSQAALLDTRFGDEQTGAEFSGAVERLQERQKRKRHDALIAKKERTPQEDAEMLELTGQLGGLRKSSDSSQHNAIILGSRSTP